MMIKNGKERMIDRQEIERKMLARIGEWQEGIRRGKDRKNERETGRQTDEQQNTAFTTLKEKQKQIKDKNNNFKKRKKTKKKQKKKVLTTIDDNYEGRGKGDRRYIGKGRSECVNDREG